MSKSILLFIPGSSKLNGKYCCLSVIVVVLIFPKNLFSQEADTTSDWQKMNLRGKVKNLKTIITATGAKDSLLLYGIEESVTEISFDTAGYKTVENIDAEGTETDKKIVYKRGFASFVDNSGNKKLLGRVLQETEYKPVETFYKRTVTTYDSLYKPTSEVRYFQDSINPVMVINFIYERERLLRKIDETQYGVTKTDYEYDTLGRLVAEYMFNANNHLTQTNEYSYDKAGNVLTSSIHFTSDKNVHRYHYKYDDSDHLIQKESEVYSRKNKEVYFYDNFGRNFKIEVFEDGQPKGYELFSYNKKGEVILHKEFSSTEKLVVRTNYEYDQTGNKILSVAGLYNGLTKVTKRLFLYYE